MKLVLHIDRLVLRGVAPEQRDAVVQQLRLALTREWAQPGLAQRWASSGQRAGLRLSFTPTASTPVALASGAARVLANGDTR